MSDDEWVHPGKLIELPRPQARRRNQQRSAGSGAGRFIPAALVREGADSEWFVVPGAQALADQITA